MSFYLYTANDPEKLADAFRKNIYMKVPSSNSPENVLTPVVAAVLTQGMSAWLRIYLAENTPVAVNISTPFIRSDIESVLELLDPQHFRHELEFFRREKMPWQIFSWFSSAENRASLPNSVCRYLENDPDYRKRFQLSEKLAGLYDQYQIYRSDMMAAWRTKDFRAEDEVSAWQSRIYQEVFGAHKSIDVYLHEFLNRDLSALPIRPSSSVFGISALPPDFLRFYARLSEYSDVSFFYMNPTRDFLSDVISRTEARRKGVAFSEYRDTAAYFNPILAGNCAQGRAFFDELLNIQEVIPVIDHDLQRDYCVQNSEESLLHIVQQDIYDNCNRASLPGKKELDANDRSLSVHSCHSRVREIEVLHDQLLKELLSPDVEPCDILVMMPDVNEYSACIESVFGRGPLRNLYSITDRSLQDSGVLVPVFLQILSAASGTFPFSEISDLLEYPFVTDRFSIARESLPEIRLWLKNAGVRWGIDSAMREKVSGVAFEEYSWRAGLDRLLYGFAVRERDVNDQFVPVYPLDAVEGSAAAYAGPFFHLMEALFELHVSLKQNRTPAEWFRFLQEILDRFILPSEECHEEYSEFFRMLCSMQETASSCCEKVPFVMISGLLQNPPSNGLTAPFLRGRITFCSMIPMRSIPMKIVAVLGLNDGEFPRRNIELGFNLISSGMKATDRSRLLEDRYLFLEAILSARKKLILSYIGSDAKTNTAIPPAVPLNELLEYIRSSFRKNGEKYEPVIRERLQPWDFDYYSGKDPNLFSYSSSGAASAHVLAEYLKTQKSVSTSTVYQRFQGYSADPGKFALPESVSVNDFIAFFKNPAAAFLFNVSGMDFARYSESTESDSEPFDLNNLELYQLRNEAAKCSLEHIDKKEQFEKLKRLILMPIGVLGKTIFEKIERENDVYLESISPFLRENIPADILIHVGKHFISGSLPAWPDQTGTSYFELAEADGCRILENYLRHLIFCASGKEFTTYALLRKKQFLLKPVPPETALRQLEKLLSLMEKGFLEPLPFFPKTSFLFSNTAISYSAEDLSKKLTDKLFNTRFSSGEIEADPAFRTLFDKKDLEDPVFQTAFLNAAGIVFDGLKMENLKNE